MRERVERNLRYRHKFRDAANARRLEMYDAAWRECVRREAVASATRSVEFAVPSVRVGLRIRKASGSMRGVASRECTSDVDKIGQAQRGFGKFGPGFGKNSGWTFLELELGSSLSTDGAHDLEYAEFVRAMWGALHSKEHLWQVPGLVQEDVHVSCRKMSRAIQNSDTDLMRQGRSVSGGAGVWGDIVGSICFRLHDEASSNAGDCEMWSRIESDFDARVTQKSATPQQRQEPDGGKA